MNEAQHLSEISKQCDFDSVFCSPLTRARQTAAAIVGARDIPVIYDNRLIERSFGDLESKSVDRPDGKACRYSFAVKYPNGESYMQVAARIYRFLDELKEKYSDNNIFIVSHGSVC